MKTRTCAKCGEEKSLDDFHRKKATKIDGKAAKCKSCQNKYLKEWRLEDSKDYYIVYYLPEEHYVGITKQPKQRIAEHKSRLKRNTDGWKVLFCSEDKYEAHLVEAELHCMGFKGLRTDI